MHTASVNTNGGIYISLTWYWVRVAPLTASYVSVRHVRYKQMLNLYNTSLSPFHLVRVEVGHSLVDAQSPHLSEVQRLLA